MTVTSFLSCVEHELAPNFARLGFKLLRTRSSFESDQKGHLERVVIDPIRRPSSDSIILNFYLHLRHHNIEDILNSFRPHINKDNQMTTVTICKYFGELLPQGAQDSLIVTDTGDIRSVCKVAFDAYLEYAAPFFARFSDVDRVCAAFLAKPVNWPSRDKLARLEFLLAYHSLRRNQAAFDSLLPEVAEFAAKCNSGFHKSYLDGLVKALTLRLHNVV